MEESPSPSTSSQEWTRESSTPSDRSLRRSHRHAAEEDDGAEPIECTGKSCQSCTTGLITDCVAVCCCPCAVVDIMLFTFLKVPYVMGRKWLKKKKKKKSLEKKKKSNNGGGNRDGISRKVIKVDDEEIMENISIEFGDDEEGKDSFSARFDAEEVWLELYQIGHLGFGRVSFSGIPSQSKGPEL